MSFQSLIAHNGVVHQKSNSLDKSTESTVENKPSKQPNTNSKTVAPEGKLSSEQQILEAPESKTEALPISETQFSPILARATLFPGFGESIFTLLIASPFLLFGLKKWLHK